MSGRKCHACGRRITRANRALMIVAGAVGACVACSHDYRLAPKANRELEAADALGTLPTRQAVGVQRRYHAA